MPNRSIRDLAAAAGRLRDWARHHLVERDLADARGLPAWALRQLHYLRTILVGLVWDADLGHRASSLTYNTLLSIVPLLAVAFALFKAFGGLSQLEEPARELIVENLAVGAAEQVSAYLDQFIENISAGAIGGVGFLFLIWTVWRMLVNVEGAFNAIWGVTRGRSLALSLAVYWTIITLAPILLALSISVTAALQEGAIAGRLTGLHPELVTWMFGGVSVLAVCLAFGLVFRIMPHTQVWWRAAFMGGLVSGVLWHLSKIVYLYLSSTIFRYGAVYGALGVLPIFFIWIRLSWLIVLAGARYSFVFQQGLVKHAAASLPLATQRYRERVALRVAVALAACKRAREAPPSLPTLARRTGATPSLILDVLRTLEVEGLVLSVQTSGGATYTLTRDTADLTAAEVVVALRDKLGKSYPLRDDARWSGVEELLARTEGTSRGELARVSLAELAEQCGDDPGPEPAGPAAPTPEPPAET